MTQDTSQRGNMRAKVTFQVLITTDQENKNATDLQDSFPSIVSEILLMGDSKLYAFYSPNQASLSHLHQMYLITYGQEIHGQEICHIIKLYTCL